MPNIQHAYRLHCLCRAAAIALDDPDPDWQPL